MCPVSLWSKKYNWGHDGQGEFTAKVQDTMAAGIPIINFSGSWDSDPILADICAEYHNANGILVASAGNDTGPVLWPAHYSSVVAVSGINNAGEIRYFNLGPEIDFTAHSEELWTTTGVSDPDGHSEACYRVSGTSFAAPITAGAAALLLSYNPELYNDDVYNLLSMSATYSGLDPGAYSLGAAFGNGLIQAGAALDSLLMNTLVCGTVSGSSRVTSNYRGMITVQNLPGASSPDGRYTVTMYTCEKDVVFPAGFVATPHVWGRTVDTNGTKPSLANPLLIDQKRYCEVVPGSATSDGCTLRSYAYKLIGPWPYTTEHWFPEGASNMTWGYAALGRDGVVAVRDEMPRDAQLTVAPNPFNARATFEFSSRQAEMTTISIFDLRGRKVLDLYDGFLASGRHSYAWDGTDAAGKTCASGVYVVRAKAASGERTMMFTLVK